jgi:hypothetical protein
VTGAGILSVDAGMALAPLVTTPWQLYLTLGALVSGGTLARGYTAHALFLPNWFVRKRGLAIGVAFAGVGVGSIAMLPGIQSVIEHTTARSSARSACSPAAVRPSVHGSRAPCTTAPGPHRGLLARHRRLDRLRRRHLARGPPPRPHRRRPHTAIARIG